MRITMIRNSSDDQKGFEAKQEGHVGNSASTNLKASSSSTSASRQWSGFRNPRIVRVSRTFGGKDRHSKVSTIRGLRDRRIRLSVPTAIQLYDLQDRLGLSQPSKVIDWLLDATEHDIDKLPPLQVPHHGFGHQYHHHHPQFLDPQSNSINLAAAPFFDHHEADQNKGKSIKTSHQQDHDQDGNEVAGGGFSGQLLPHKLFPIGNNVPTSIPGLLNNAMPYNYNNYYNLNNSDHQYPPSSLSLSQFGSSHGFNYPVVPQIDHHQHQHQHQHSHMMMMNNGLLSSFSSSSMQPISSGSYQPQLFFCTPSTATIPSLFAPYPPYITSTTPVLESTSTTSVPNFLPNTLMPSPHNAIGSATLKNNNGSTQLPNKDHAGS